MKHPKLLLLHFLPLSHAFTTPSPHSRAYSATKTSIHLSSDPNNLSRRDVSSLLLSSLLAPLTTPAAGAAEAKTPKTVVITGCNSGIGLDAATRLAQRDDANYNIVMACRTLAKATAAANAVKESTPATNANIIPMECDLSSLSSISSFADSLKGLFISAASGGGVVPFVDALCLNAGVARDVGAKDVLRTRDGFEYTVGINHLGHFYLNHLLLPSVVRGGRIVVTASSVHDPDSPGGAQGSRATLGDLKGLETRGRDFEMVDGGDFDADKAYKDSKLCNVFFTRELQRRLNEGDSGISVNCFSPGLIVGTGLFRDQNPVFTKIFDVAATNILKVGETVHWGGGTLEYMATSSDIIRGGMFYTAAPGASRYGEAAYGREFTVSEVSKEAKDSLKGRRLWELSEKLVGI